MYIRQNMSTFASLLCLIALVVVFQGSFSNANGSPHKLLCASNTQRSGLSDETYALLSNNVIFFESQLHLQAHTEEDTQGETPETKAALEKVRRHIQIAKGIANDIKLFADFTDDSINRLEVNIYDLAAGYVVELCEKALAELNVAATTHAKSYDLDRAISKLSSFVRAAQAVETGVASMDDLSKLRLLRDISASLYLVVQTPHIERAREHVYSATKEHCLASAEKQLALVKQEVVQQARTSKRDNTALDQPASKEEQDLAKVHATLAELIKGVRSSEDVSSSVPMLSLDEQMSKIEQAMALLASVQLTHKNAAFEEASRFFSDIRDTIEHQGKHGSGATTMAMQEKLLSRAVVHLTRAPAIAEVTVALDLAKQALARAAKINHYEQSGHSGANVDDNVHNPEYQSRITQTLIADAVKVLTDLSGDKGLSEEAKTILSKDKDVLVAVKLLRTALNDERVEQLRNELMATLAEQQSHDIRTHQQGHSPHAADAHGGASQQSAVDADLSRAIADSEQRLRELVVSAHADVEEKAEGETSPTTKSPSAALFDRLHQVSLTRQNLARVMKHLPPERIQAMQHTLDMIEAEIHSEQQEVSSGTAMHGGATASTGDDDVLTFIRNGMDEVREWAALIQQQLDDQVPSTVDEPVDEQGRYPHRYSRLERKRILSKLDLVNAHLYYTSKSVIDRVDHNLNSKVASSTGIHELSVSLSTSLQQLQHAAHAMEDIYLRDVTDDQRDKSYREHKRLLQDRILGAMHAIESRLQYIQDQLEAEEREGAAAVHGSVDERHAKKAQELLLRGDEVGAYLAQMRRKDVSKQHHQSLANDVNGHVVNNLLREAEKALAVARVRGDTRVRQAEVLLSEASAMEIPVLADPVEQLRQRRAVAAMKQAKVDTAERLLAEVSVDHAAHPEIKEALRRMATVSEIQDLHRAYEMLSAVPPSEEIMDVLHSIDQVQMELRQVALLEHDDTTDAATRHAKQTALTARARNILRQAVAALATKHSRLGNVAPSKFAEHHPDLAHGSAQTLHAARFLDSVAQRMEQLSREGHDDVDSLSKYDKELVEAAALVKSIHEMDNIDEAYSLLEQLERIPLHRMREYDKEQLLTEVRSRLLAAEHTIASEKARQLLEKHLEHTRIGEALDELQREARRTQNPEVIAVVRELHDLQERIHEDIKANRDDAATTNKVLLNAGHKLSKHNVHSPATRRAMQFVDAVRQQLRSDRLHPDAKVDAELKEVARVVNNMLVHDAEDANTTDKGEVLNVLKVVHDLRVLAAKHQSEQALLARIEALEHLLALVMNIYHHNPKYHNRRSPLDRVVDLLHEVLRDERVQWSEMKLHAANAQNKFNDVAKIQDRLREVQEMMHNPHYNDRRVIAHMLDGLDRDIKATSAPDDVKLQIHLAVQDTLADAKRKGSRVEQELQEALDELHRMGKEDVTREAIGVLEHALTAIAHIREQYKRDYAPESEEAGAHTTVDVMAEKRREEAEGQIRLLLTEASRRLEQMQHNTPYLEHNSHLQEAQALIDLAEAEKNIENCVIMLTKLSYKSASLERGLQLLQEVYNEMDSNIVGGVHGRAEMLRELEFALISLRQALDEYVSHRTQHPLEHDGEDTDRTALHKVVDIVTETFTFLNRHHGADVPAQLKAGQTLMDARNLKDVETILDKLQALPLAGKRAVAQSQLISELQARRDVMKQRRPGEKFRRILRPALPTERDLGLGMDIRDYRDCAHQPGHHLAGRQCVPDAVCMPTSCNHHGTCQVKEGNINCLCDPGFISVGNRFCNACAARSAVYPNCFTRELTDEFVRDSQSTATCTAPLLPASLNVPGLLHSAQRTVHVQDTYFLNLAVNQHAVHLIVEEESVLRLHTFAQHNDLMLSNRQVNVYLSLMDSRTMVHKATKFFGQQETSMVAIIAPGVNYQLIFEYDHAELQKQAVATGNACPTLRVDLAVTPASAMLEYSELSMQDTLDGKMDPARHQSLQGRNRNPTTDTSVLTETIMDGTFAPIQATAIAAGHGGCKAQPSVPRFPISEDGLFHVPVHGYVRDEQLAVVTGHAGRGADHAYNPRDAHFVDHQDEPSDFENGHEEIVYTLRFTVPEVSERQPYIDVALEYKFVYGNLRLLLRNDAKKLMYVAQPQHNMNFIRMPVSPGTYTLAILLLKPVTAPVPASPHALPHMQNADKHVFAVVMPECMLYTFRFKVDFAELGASVSRLTSKLVSNDIVADECSFAQVPVHLNVPGIMGYHGSHMHLHDTYRYDTVNLVRYSHFELKKTSVLRIHVPRASNKHDIEVVLHHVSDNPITGTVSEHTYAETDADSLLAAFDGLNSALDDDYAGMHEEDGVKILHTSFNRAQQPAADPFAAYRQNSDSYYKDGKRLPGRSTRASPLSHGLMCIDAISHKTNTDAIVAELGPGVYRLDFKASSARVLPLTERHCKGFTMEMSIIPVIAADNMSARECRATGTQRPAIPNQLHDGLSVLSAKQSAPSVEKMDLSSASQNRARMYSYVAHVPRAKWDRETPVEAWEFWVKDLPAGQDTLMLELDIDSDFTRAPVVAYLEESLHHGDKQTAYEQAYASGKTASRPSAMDMANEVLHTVGSRAQQRRFDGTPATSLDKNHHQLRVALRPGFYRLALYLLAPGRFDTLGYDYGYSGHDDDFVCVEYDLSMRVTSPAHTPFVSKCQLRNDHSHGLKRIPDALNTLRYMGSDLLAPQVHIANRYMFPRVQQHASMREDLLARVDEEAAGVKPYQDKAHYYRYDNGYKPQQRHYHHEAYYSAPRSFVDHYNAENGHGMHAMEVNTATVRTEMTVPSLSLFRVAIDTDGFPLVFSVVRHLCVAKPGEPLEAQPEGSATLVQPWGKYDYHREMGRRNAKSGCLDVLYTNHHADNDYSVHFNAVLEPGLYELVFTQLPQSAAGELHMITDCVGLDMQLALRALHTMTEPYILPHRLYNVNTAVGRQEARRVAFDRRQRSPFSVDSRNMHNRYGIDGDARETRRAVDHDAEDAHMSEEALLLREARLHPHYKPHATLTDINDYSAFVPLCPAMGSDHLPPYPPRQLKHLYSYDSLRHNEHLFLQQRFGEARSFSMKFTSQHAFRLHARITYPFLTGLYTISLHNNANVQYKAASEAHKEFHRNQYYAQEPHNQHLLAAQDAQAHDTSVQTEREADALHEVSFAGVSRYNRHTLSVEVAPPGEWVITISEVAAHNDNTHHKRDAVANRLALFCSYFNWRLEIEPLDTTAHALTLPLAQLGVPPLSLYLAAVQAALPRFPALPHSWDSPAFLIPHHHFHAYQFYSLRPSSRRSGTSRHASTYFRNEVVFDIRHRSLVRVAVAPVAKPFLDAHLQVRFVLDCATCDPHTMHNSVQQTFTPALSTLYATLDPGQYSLSLFPVTSRMPMTYFPYKHALDVAVESAVSPVHSIIAPLHQLDNSCKTLADARFSVCEPSHAMYIQRPAAPHNSLNMHRELTMCSHMHGARVHTLTVALREPSVVSVLVQYDFLLNQLHPRIVDLINNHHWDPDMRPNGAQVHATLPAGYYNITIDSLGKRTGELLADECLRDTYGVIVHISPSGEAANIDALAHFQHKRQVHLADTLPATASFEPTAEEQRQVYMQIEALQAFKPENVHKLPHAISTLHTDASDTVLNMMLEKGKQCPRIRLPFDLMPNPQYMQYLTLKHGVPEPDEFGIVHSPEEVQQYIQQFHQLQGVSIVYNPHQFARMSAPYVEVRHEHPARSQHGDVNAAPPAAEDFAEGSLMRAFSSALSDTDSADKSQGAVLENRGDSVRTLRIASGEDSLLFVDLRAHHRDVRFHKIAVSSVDRDGTRHAVEHEEASPIDLLPRVMYDFKKGPRAQQVVWLPSTEERKRQSHYYELDVYVHAHAGANDEEVASAAYGIDAEGNMVDAHGSIMSARDANSEFKHARQSVCHLYSLEAAVVPVSSLQDSLLGEGCVETLPPSTIPFDKHGKSVVVMPEAKWASNTIDMVMATDRAKGFERGVSGNQRGEQYTSAANALYADEDRSHNNMLAKSRRFRVHAMEDSVISVQLRHSFVSSSFRVVLHQVDAEDGTPFEIARAKTSTHLHDVRQRKVENDLIKAPLATVYEFDTSHDLSMRIPAGNYHVEVQEQLATPLHELLLQLATLKIDAYQAGMNPAEYEALKQQLVALQHQPICVPFGFYLELTPLYQLDSHGKATLHVLKTMEARGEVNQRFSRANYGHDKSGDETSATQCQSWSCGCRNVDVFAHTYTHFTDAREDETTLTRPSVPVAHVPKETCHPVGICSKVHMSVTRHNAYTCMCAPGYSGPRCDRCDERLGYTGYPDCRVSADQSLARAIVEQRDDEYLAEVEREWTHGNDFAHSPDRQQSTQTESAQLSIAPQASSAPGGSLMEDQTARAEPNSGLTGEHGLFPLPFSTNEVTEATDVPGGPTTPIIVPTVPLHARPRNQRLEVEPEAPESRIYCNRPCFRGHCDYRTGRCVTDEDVIVPPADPTIKPSAPGAAGPARPLPMQKGVDVVHEAQVSRLSMWAQMRQGIWFALKVTAISVLFVFGIGALIIYRGGDSAPVRSLRTFVHWAKLQWYKLWKQRKRVGSQYQSLHKTYEPSEGETSEEGYMVGSHRGGYGQVPTNEGTHVSSRGRSASRHYSGTVFSADDTE